MCSLPFSLFLLKSIGILLSFQRAQNKHRRKRGAEVAQKVSLNPIFYAGKDVHSITENLCVPMILSGETAVREFFNHTGIQGFLYAFMPQWFIFNFSILHEASRWDASCLSVAPLPFDSGKQISERKPALSIPRYAFGFYSRRDRRARRKFTISINPLRRCEKINSRRRPRAA
jgi:hypothetical protein